MKILIAYDGSECADAALDDLKLAGLPENAEAVVISLADVFVPPPINEEIDNTFPMYVPAGVRRAHERAKCAVKATQLMDARATEKIMKTFPGWTVRPQVSADSPAWAIIRTADKWAPDLIVVGAQGHSVLGGRLILGSVSQRVLYEARCSVRIARTRLRNVDTPFRIIVGVDNSKFSSAAVEAISQRHWPAGTE